MNPLTPQEQARFRATSDSFQKEFVQRSLRVEDLAREVERATLPFKPQPGKQEQFLTSEADICVYGGGAFSGKTYAELLEPTKHIDNPKFSCVIFRRTSPQITNPGALWDEAAKLYPLKKGKPYESSPKSYEFPSGATISFHHLQYDNTVYEWQGSQVCLIEFDELTHFSESQFFYMLSRNRSDCGIKPYIRATCNPDAGSWVASFLQWWWNPEDGLPYEDRCGVLRWFVRMDDKLIWADSREELIEELGEDGKDAKSVTFISASIYDNPIGMKSNPGYLASLKALPYVERERLLGRNWKIVARDGNIFKLEDFHYVKDYTRDPHGYFILYWDWASSDKETADRTAATLLYKIPAGQYFVVNHFAARLSPGKRNEYMKNVCRDVTDRYGEIGKIVIVIEAPNMSVEIVTGIRQYLINAGFATMADNKNTAKEIRADPLATAMELKNVFFVEGLWNRELQDEMLLFPNGEHDDRVDTISGAYYIASKMKIG